MDGMLSGSSLHREPAPIQGHAAAESDEDDFFLSDGAPVANADADAGEDAGGPVVAAEAVRPVPPAAAPTEPPPVKRQRGTPVGHHHHHHCAMLLREALLKC